MGREGKARRRSKRPAPLSARERAAARPKGGGRLRHWIAVLVAVAILISVVVVTLLSFYRSDQPDQPSSVPTVAGPENGPRAVIVDHLSLSQPNPAFAERATDLLQQAGPECTHQYFGHPVPQAHAATPGRCLADVVQPCCRQQIRFLMPLLL